MKTKRTKRKLVAEINVVPYIDVTLVLLVVFMITAPLLMQGVKVELPDANSAPMDTKDQEPFIVSIKADGSYWIDVSGENKAEKHAQRPLDWQRQPCQRPVQAGEKQRENWRHPPAPRIKRRT